MGGGHILGQNNPDVEPSVPQLDSGCESTHWNEGCRPCGRFRTSFRSVAMRQLHSWDDPLAVSPAAALHAPTADGLEGALAGGVTEL